MSTFQTMKAMFEEREKEASKPKIAPKKSIAEIQAVRRQANRETVEKVERSVGIKNLTRAMEDIYNAVVVDTGTDYVGKVPESLFVEYFLPMFKQTVEEVEALDSEGKERREKLYTDWVKLAGGHFNEVAVVDGQGNTLFKVPAMQTTRIINPARKENAPGFSAIIKQASLLELQSPVRGLDFQKKELTGKLLQMASNKSAHLDDERRWMEIFARYAPETPKQTTTTSASSNNFDDEIEYD